MSAYVSIRQQHAIAAPPRRRLCIRQQMSAYVSQHTSAACYCCTATPPPPQRPFRQYSYFYTSKASKLSTSQHQPPVRAQPVFVVRQTAGAAAWHRAVGTLYIWPAYVSIRQHTSAYVSIRQHTAWSPWHFLHLACRGQHTSAYVSIREHAAWSRWLSLHLDLRDLRD
jgi:hypothetical protein